LRRVPRSGARYTFRRGECPSSTLAS
jgi:hypothetical protein